MKRVLLATIAVVLVSALLLAGCGPKAPEQIVLRYAGGMPLDHHITKTMELFAQLVGEKTDGRVLVEVYPAEELYHHKDMPTPLSTGAVDIGLMDSAAMGGLSEATSLSSLGYLITDYDKQLEVHRAGAEIVDRELEPNGIKLLFWHVYGADTGVMTTDKQVKTLEDLKLLKIRGYGEIQCRWLDLAGASSVYISSSEVYQAMATGALDGAMSGYGSLYTRRWYEVAEYLVDTNWSIWMMLTCVNLEKWNSLPKDVQNAILEASREAEAWEASVVIEKDEGYIAGLKEEGVIFTKLSAEEEARWMAIATPIYDEWAARSPEAAEFLALAKKLR